MSDQEPTDGLPRYRNLDENEAAQAAKRMEARSHVPASDLLFETLVAPLLEHPDALLMAQSGGRRVLEVGSGPGSLSRRLARHANDLHLVATDKSPQMIEFARERIEEEGLAQRVRALVLDALLLPKKLGGPVDRILWSAPYAASLAPSGFTSDGDSFSNPTHASLSNSDLNSSAINNITHTPGFDPSIVETSLVDISEVRSFLAEGPHTMLEEDTLDEDDGEDTDDEEMGFSLIFSSVMLPYLDPDEQRQVIDRLAARLAVGGVLCFIEQELLSDFVSLGDLDLERRALGKDVRKIPGLPSHALRGIMRSVGLELMDEQRCLWTCNDLNPYVEMVLESSMSAAVEHGRMTPTEKAQAMDKARALDASGDFSYGITYRRIAGVRSA